MKPSLALAALVSALACTGCSSLPRDGVQVALSQPFTLRPGERAALPQQASLRYVGVENDSRCPPQVQCVWAGDADVKLVFEQAGAVTDARPGHVPARDRSRWGPGRCTLVELGARRVAGRHAAPR